jgi:hypothetical protein
MVGAKRGLMGHTRLGEIPKTREWQEVVAALNTAAAQQSAVEGAGMVVADISAKTLEAAQGGIAKAKEDRGLAFTFFLLTQIALASRSAEWLTRLRDLGLAVTPTSSLFDLNLQLQQRIDDYLTSVQHSTDVSEMAQRAAGEALAALAQDNAETLFGNSGEELRNAIRSLSTRKGFAELGHTFFGRFTSHFLNFYLSRIAASQVGRGIGGITDVSQLNDQLGLHCYETARIVRDFCGQWYSKTEFTRGIDLHNTLGFVAVAIDKLQSELMRQRKGA